MLLRHASLDTTRRYLDATAGGLRDVVRGHPGQRTLREHLAEPPRPVLQAQRTNYVKAAAMPNDGESLSVTVSSLRLLVEREGTFYKLARLGWSQKDTSVYLMLYVPVGGQSYAGVVNVPSIGGPPATFNYGGQLCGTGMPKLSLHESGQCHAEVDGVKTKPVKGRDVFHGAGGHIASVTSFSVVGLPIVVSPKGPPKLDIPLTSSDPTWTATHVSLHICPTPEDARGHHFSVALARPGKPRPLLIGVSGQPTAESPENHNPGVTAIAGWGPGESRSVPGIFATTTGAEP